MFEKSLSESLKTIFDLKKVTFDLASISHEQECIFIEVISAHNNISDASFRSKVTGHIKIYCSNAKLPYGYLSKRIAEADKLLTAPFFFYNFEDNKGIVDDVDDRVNCRVGKILSNRSVEEQKISRIV